MFQIFRTIVTWIFPWRSLIGLPNWCRAVQFASFSLRSCTWHEIYGCPIFKWFAVFFIRLRRFIDRLYGGDRHARCLITLPSNFHQWIYGWIEWLCIFRHLSKQIPHSCIAGSLRSEIPWPRVYRQIGSVMMQSASCMNVTIASSLLHINMQILPNSQGNLQPIIII